VFVPVAGIANAPMVLVGNKSDLPRQVSLETVLQTKAELLSNCPYIETSAKFNLNVIKLFIELLQVSRIAEIP
jgi:GTPase SAR1 family protein